MILDLGDGRELPLPDEMSDETARQLKRLILSLEERARVAEADVRRVMDELAAARQPAQSAKDGTVEAIQALQAAIERGFARMIQAQLADTVLVNDGLREEPNTARKVVRGG